MADAMLTAQEPFGELQMNANGVTLSGIIGKVLVSAAIPNGGEQAFVKALQNGYGADVPAPGRTAQSADGTLLIGLQRDQIFLLFDRSDEWPEHVVAKKMGKSAYLTDQSDGWVMARMSGTRCREALERICRLDLAPTIFAQGMAARTVMEHLNVIVLRDGNDSYLLMSPRSSADSFCHALESSIRNIG